MKSIFGESFLMGSQESNNIYYRNYAWYDKNIVGQTDSFVEKKVDTFEYSNVLENGTEDIYNTGVDDVSALLMNNNRKESLSCVYSSLYPSDSLCQSLQASYSNFRLGSKAFNSAVSSGSFSDSLFLGLCFMFLIYSSIFKTRT